MDRIVKGYRGYNAWVLVTIVEELSEEQNNRYFFNKFISSEKVQDIIIAHVLKENPANQKDFVRDILMPLNARFEQLKEVEYESNIRYSWDKGGLNRFTFERFEKEIDTHLQKYQL